jgi:hypothetical protein
MMKLAFLATLATSLALAYGNDGSMVGMCSNSFVEFD